MTPDRVVVRLTPGCSDGDPLHVPAEGTHTQVSPPTLYLEKIAMSWMQQRGEARPGVQYILEALPAGYTMWHRPRPSDPKCFDKYLFGHPSHKRFDSPNRFFPHFQYLMDNAGNSIGCPCTVCRGSSGLLPRAPPNSSCVRSSGTTSRRSSTVSVPVPSHHMPASAPQQRPMAQGRPKLNPGLDIANVDQDGTPDVYRNLIDKLRGHNYIDQVIQEPLSPDWRVEQESLPKLLQTLRSQDQWVPRNGDIVLFIRDLADGLTVLRNDVTDDFQLYDERHDKFLHTPQWEAGLVTQVAPDPKLTDLSEPNMKSNVIYSGLRVEPVPSPNNVDKSLSKRYKHVSLRQTRPFFLWKELLYSIDPNQWHASIKNALALTSTLSLMGKYRFRGTWPDATIYCHGIFIGAEMLVVGDTVRLLPSTRLGQAASTDILCIRSIRLKWSNLDKCSDNDYDEGRPYNSEIMIYGSAYTSDASRSNTQNASRSNDRDAEPLKAADGYASFYPLHPSDKELAVPYARVVGRLYERSAMGLLLGPDADYLLDLDLGREAMTEARAFSRKHDKRITESPNATWYWGDNRADALNLHTLNGLSISTLDPERDVKTLRKHCRILDGGDDGDDGEKLTMDNVSNGRGLRRFMAPALPLHTSTNISNAKQGFSSASALSDDNPSSVIGKKRPCVIDVDNNGSDDEIREYTRIVDDRALPKKKAKVLVVID